MTPAGYLAKNIRTEAGWLENDVVEDIWSVSACLSPAFCDFVPYWRHNGYWLFDSPAVIGEIAAEEGVDLSGMRMFYYEVHGEQFDCDAGTWSVFAREASLPTRVQIPARKQLEGFDVVSFAAQTAPECSPLSCNGLARDIAVNKHCLLATLEEAKTLLETGCFKDCEPGPYRVFAIHTVTQV
ncbi:MAG: hypothetical protein AMJ66_01435 [Betaproteobacteria bacterium SG8_40]|nr:MAG: hypothetical protein AMJ66_01435 [Betaproteobacteria bacterium SG8_40]